MERTTYRDPDTPRRYKKYHIEHDWYGCSHRALLALGCLLFLCMPVLVSCSARTVPSGDAASASSPLHIGDQFAAYTLEDQFREKHSLAPETRRVILSRNMELSKELNAWLAQREPEYLTKNRIEYISDISAMPRIISRLFARPKMQKYPFRILLAEDEDFSAKYGAREDLISVFDLTPDHKIRELHYVSSVTEIPPLPQ